MSLEALITGNVGGLIINRALGQIFTRWYVLRKCGFSLSRLSILTAYEQSLTLFSLLALYSIFYLQNVNFFSLPDTSASHFINITLASIILVSFFRPSYNFILKPALLYLSSNFRIKSLPIDITLSLISIALMAIAYYSLLGEIGKSTNLATVFTSIFSIMLAASLPISLGGWGVRETASVFMLTQIGVPITEAFLISVIVGVFGSLVAISLFSLLRITQIFYQFDYMISNFIPLSKAKVIKSAFYVLIAVLPVALTMQIKVPINGSLIQVTLSDPLIVIAIFMIIINPSKLHIVQFSIAQNKHLNLIIGLISFAILYSFCIGYINFGLTSWAIFNRLIGWIIILAYIFIAMKIHFHLGTRTLDLIIQIFVHALFIFACVSLIKVIIIQMYPDLSKYILPQGAITGGGFNRNSFAFLLFFSIILHFYQTKNYKYPDRIILIILMTAVIVSGSKAAIICLGLYGIWCLLLRIGERARILEIFIMSIIFSALILNFGNLISFLMMIGNHFGVENNLQILNYHLPLSNPSSNVERWETIVGGFNLFVASPIFGSGLGSFYQWSIDNLSRPNVIHSTPVWVLAEMGLVGATIIVFGVTRIAIALRRTKGTEKRLILAIIELGLLFGLFGLVHDIFYQRVFWFFLALMLAHVVLQEKRHAKREKKHL